MTAGGLWRGTAVATVTPRAFPSDGALLRLRLADFSALQASFGSVRLGFSATNVLGPMPPFILTRDSSRYYCVSSQCTHAGTLIPAFLGAGKRSTCPNHGSVFAPDGSVIRGPATEPLPRYPVTVLDGGILEVELLDLPPYQVAIERVTDGGGSRVAISFQPVRNAEHEVLASASLAGPWERVAFARTVLGPADQVVITGGQAPLTVWVDPGGSHGIRFFSVSVRVRVV